MSDDETRAAAPAAESAYRGTSFAGADFTLVDFRETTLRDCDLSGMRVVDSVLVDVAFSGALGSVVVNDVDVTAYVEGELDRRHPERAQVREMVSADEFRAAWDTVEGLWPATVARALALPDDVRDQQVHGEWSFDETLRHLVFVTDAWLLRTVLDQERPYHRLGLPQASYPPEDAAALGIDLAAEPSTREVLEARASRMATVRGVVDGLADDDLDRRCSRNPAPGYPEEPPTVRQCLRVVMREECEHHRYAVRDLAVLEAGG